MPTLVTSIVGRLVWGHPLEAQQRTDPQTKQKVFKDGQPVMSYPFGVAYEKQAFLASEQWKVMNDTVLAMYPQGAPPRFSWKLKDGDGIDSNGKPFRDREGYAGCYVINYDTQFTVNAFRPNAAGGWDQITKNDFKTGDYIAVSVSIDGNKPSAGSQNTPSLYLNTQGILHIGNGKEIVNTPSADQMFAGHQYQLPPGAAPPGAPPAMPTGMPNPPGMGGIPQPPGYQPNVVGGAPQAPQYAPQPQAPQYAPQPQAPQYQPAPDFVQAAMGQPQQQPGVPSMTGQYAPPAGNAPTPGYSAPTGYPAPQPTTYHSSPQPGAPGNYPFPPR